MIWSRQTINSFCPSPFTRYYLALVLHTYINSHALFPLCLSMSFTDRFFWTRFLLFKLFKIGGWSLFSIWRFLINFGGYFLLSLTSAYLKFGIFSSAFLISKTKKAITAFQPLLNINKPKIPSFGSFRCVVYECGWYVLPFLFNVNLIC